MQDYCKGLGLSKKLWILLMGVDRNFSTGLVLGVLRGFTAT